MDELNSSKAIVVETEELAVVKNSEDDPSPAGEKERSGICAKEVVNDWDEMPGYIPTREELVRLLEHWYRQVLSVDWWQFTTGTRWGSDHRLRYYGCARIEELTTVLGDGAVKTAIEVVENAFKAGHDARLWDIFKNGTPEQWEVVLNELGGPL